MKKLPLIAAALLLIGLLTFVLMPQAPTAPDFPPSTDLNGQTFSRTDLNGRVTLLNFWYPSCPGCVSEMPKLVQTAHDHQGKNLQIIGIAVPIDPLASVQNYARTRQLPFRIVFDHDKALTGRFIRAELYPTSILLDKQGRIVKTFVGEPDFPDLYRQIDTLLAD